MRILAKDIDSEVLAKRLLRLMESATAEEIEYGRNWYIDAHKFAGAIAAKYGITISQAAGIIAALSPGVTWESNVIDAVSICELRYDAVVSTYPNNQDKAIRIFDGESPLSVLGGNKVRSFYHNILEPNVNDTVTLDRHAARGALGLDLDPVQATYYVNTDNKYRKVTQAYKIAAAELGYKAHELQAIIWLIVRRLLGLGDAVPAMG